MPSSGNSRRPRVLVVEADAIIGLDLIDALDEAGYEVIGPHATCAEALAWLDVETPSAAILDLTLENGKCADVGRFLRERKIPIVAFSIRSEIRAGRGEFHDIPWLEKPLPSARVVRALTNHLAQWSPRDRH